MKWSIAANVAFDHGIAATVRALRDLEGGIGGLPNTGVPKDLREAARENLEAVADALAQEDFFKRKADLSTLRTAIEGRVANAVGDMRAAQSERILATEGELLLLPEWAELTAEEQAGTLAEIQALSMEVPPDMAGLKRVVSRQFDIDATIADTKAKVVKEGKARRHPLPSPVPPGEYPVPKNERGRKSVPLPARIGTVAELDALIRTLSDLRHELLSNELDLVVKGN